MRMSIVIDSPERTSGMSHVWYSVRDLEISKTLSVTASGAGPPFAMLYLIPKSFLGPPGLWLAVSRMPPVAPRARMTCDTAGVEKMPCWPTMRCFTRLPAERRMMDWMHSGLK